ncbi:2Fe-2S iron-sulfur cluster-binding protein [Pseudomonas sp. NPDC086251]|uniref:2Fe-2S iron-sulfur cluster-binding protein n=1 Tax=Pseudomonas sp. NPDC086251 TaxID=3364431 RepID=UPI003833CB58
MPLYTLTVLPAQHSFLLSANAPLTDIEYEANGKNVIPFGCRTGACGACTIKVIEGHDNLTLRDDDEQTFLDMLGYSGSDYRLACQCCLKGAVTLEVIR